jgi:hypothetical protein
MRFGVVLPDADDDFDDDDDGDGGDGGIRTCSSRVALQHTPRHLQIAACSGAALWNKLK